MTSCEAIAGRLQEVLPDGKWIANTNYLQQIESVTWEQATQKIEDLNTIHTLTYHINYYIAGMLNVFNGGNLEIRDKYSFDAPPINSEVEWQALIKTFVSNAQKFVLHVRQMKDSKLNEAFVHKKYGTYLRNIEGVIEHVYYHLGQVSLIKKLVEGSAN